MMEFKPETKSLFKSAFFLVLAAFCFRYSNHVAWDWLSSGFLLSWIVSIYSILAQSHVVGKANLYKNYALFAESISADKMPTKRLHALGIKFPYIQVDYNDLELVYFYKDTGVPLDFFIKFLKNSDSGQVSPLRNWKKTKEIQYWHKIISRLYDDLQIRKDASGNHSHTWIGQWHSKLYQIFVRSDAVNLG